jgi:long-chain acyl-CoA synthetase
VLVAGGRARDALSGPEAAPRPWLGSYPPGVPATYHYPAVTLARYLDDAARDFPDVTAIQHGRARLDYTELRGRVDAVASGLADLGVTSGSVVATLLPNGPAAVIVAFAAWRLGAVLAPLPPDRPPDPGLLAEARVVVAPPDTPLSDTMRSETSTMVWADDRPRRLDRLRRRLPARRRGAPLEPSAEPVRFDRLLGADPVPPGPAPVGPDAPAVLVVADAGRATFTHANLVAASFQARLWVPDVQAGRERLLAAAPFDTPFGLAAGLLVAVLSAGTIVLPDDTVVAAIAAGRPTLLVATSEQLQAVADMHAGGADLTSLRVCLSGAGPLSPAAARRVAELSLSRVRSTFGTSVTPVTHATPVYGRAPEGGIGFPVTDTAAVLVDPEAPTRPVPVGEPGRLWVAGPQVATRNASPDASPSATRDTTAGWHDTGHLATMDAAGAFVLADAPSAHPDSRPAAPSGKVPPRNPPGPGEEATA